MCHFHMVNKCIKSDELLQSEDHAVSESAQHQLSYVGFNVLLNALQVISEKIFPANLSIGTKHPAAFSTNHLTDIDKTKHRGTVWIISSGTSEATEGQLTRQDKRELHSRKSELCTT